MATFPGFVDVAIHLKHIGDPEDMVCTFGAAYDSSFTGETLANNFKALWTTAFGGIETSPEVTIAKAVIRVGQTPPDPDLIFESSTAGATGTGSVTQLPQNNAVLVQKKTGLGGRRNQGRMYIPYQVNEGDVSSTGVLGAGGVAAKQLKADTFLADLAGGGPGEPVTPMYILHGPFFDYSTNPPTEIAPPPPPTLVTSLVVDNLIATQRRRLRR